MKLHRKINEVLGRMGMSENGKFMYGALLGYEANSYINAYGMVIRLSMYADDRKRSEISQALLSYKNRFFAYRFDNYGLTLILNDWTEGALAKRLEQLLQNVLSICKQQGALGVGYCPVCGRELNFDEAKKCVVDGMTVTIDNDCVDKINTAIDTENKIFDEAPNNYLRGFCGALVGGVAGVVVAIVLYLAGFISALSFFVAFFVGVLLYKKLGGKPNKMMIVIVTATTFVLMMASVVSIYLVATAVALNQEGLSMNVFDAFAMLLKDSEFAAAFYSDIAMTALFTVLGCVFEVIQTVRTVRRTKNL